MAAILFLSGPSNVGKSTLIKQVLMEKQIQPAGVWVQPIQKVGFELCPAAQLCAPLPSQPEHLFIDRRVRPTKIRPQVFTGYGVKLLTAAAQTPVVLLDEIGGVDLLSPPFYAGLCQLFTQPGKIIGVFKSTVNYKRQKQHQHFDVTKRRQALLQLIDRQQGSVVPVMTNQTAVYQQLNQFLA